MDVGPRTPSSVSCVTVNWNGGEDVLSCLSSLFDQSCTPQEVILVDNASRDGSLEAAVQRFPGLQVIRNDANLGFGAAVNLGVGRATGDWVALINNDAVADPEWLAEMLRVAGSAPGIGMVACKIYLNRREHMIDKIGHRLAIDGQNFGRGHRSIDHGQYDSLTEVAWPDGCAALFRRSAFSQVGGIDAEFFAYADDADLGIRLRLARWLCGFAPGAIVEHRHSQSLGAYSARKLFLVERNRIWLAAKYFPWPLLALNPVLWASRVALTLAAANHGEGPWAQVSGESRSEVMRAVLRAQFAGWRGLPRQFGKRRHLAERCGAGWQRRFPAILREAYVSLGSLARGDVV